MPEEKSAYSSEQRRGGMIAAFLAMPNDTPKKMLIVTVALCVVCSILVSSAAVTLRPLQASNKLVEKQKNILSAAGLLEEGKDIQQLFDENLEVKIVDLATGEYVDVEDAADYDQRRASKDPARSITVPAELDIAKVKRRAKYASVYLVREGERVKSVILPIKGYGLWSTLYGFLALEEDANTVVGLTFYDHAETPGLGGEVDNPRWQALWKGKHVYDDSGKPRIGLIKGNVDTSRPEAKYQVDGLAGATLTARGVTNLVRYWMGGHGFGPYLARLKTQGG